MNVIVKSEHFQPFQVITMDVDSLIPDQHTEKLKCIACNNYLSHFPIYISGGKHNICSRCYNSLSEKSNYVQNEAYESLAQFIHFSCRYKSEGCLEKLLPADIPQHEKNCSYRIIKCPTAEFTKCTWEGPMPHSLHHCQDKHFNIMLENGEFVVNLSSSYQCTNLLECDSTLFIVTRKFYAINKCLEFSISNIESETNRRFCCEITFKSSNKNLVITCEGREVTEIFLDSLKDQDKESTVVVAKVCVEKTNQAIPTIDETINHEFLAQFKCAVCGDYSMPPIYQDLNQPIGRQIKCSECRDKYFKFNIFGGNPNSKEMRNINLDKIANLLNFPCKYKENGCSVLAKPEQMQSHQLFCLYGKHNCPVMEYVDCKWNGFGKDVIAHIEESHQIMTLTNSTEISENISKILDDFNCCKLPNPAVHSINCYIFRFSNLLFRLNFVVVGQNFYWIVQPIGQLQGKYMYELELIDKTNAGQKVILRQPCATLKEKNNLLEQNNCYLQKNQIKSFIADDQIITFKITIFK
ncbi:uncharacterized protein BDFB_013396 [Asbolus verrucosus]|uniref:RING-type E3 ubiquitin transferase n=1 Tax=Asbolus verrucosus TaxID=1661398 RepID=A0A482WAF1_ASBVE|nr:uncharacterized protein BDFB_013396 [Asbolus verrucosus]